MKILITTDWYVPTINGVVMSVLNLRRELLRRGHDVRILTLSSSLRSCEADGVTYIGSIGAGIIYPGARIMAAFFSSHVNDLLAWQPDIIHSQCEFSTFLIARFISKNLNIPIVHTYHTVYEDYAHYVMPGKRSGQQVAALSRWILGYTSCVIAPTEKVQAILNRYGIDRDIHVLPTGIDLRQFTKAPSIETKTAIRQRLGIPENNRILLYVGRLAKEKNLEELFRYHARRNDPSLTLLVAGDGPYRRELERMADEWHIRSLVRFAGMIPPEQISDYYHLGDLFVSASVSETQGLTYIEALASGLPALCRKDECLNGVIMNDVNGWQYEHEQDYAAKLDRFLTDGNLQLSMREHAARLMRQKFASSVFAEKAEQIYLDTLIEPVGRANQLPTA